MQSSLDSNGTLGEGRTRSHVAQLRRLWTRRREKTNVDDRPWAKSELRVSSAQPFTYSTVPETSTMMFKTASNLLLRRAPTLRRSAVGPTRHGAASPLASSSSSGPSPTTASTSTTRNFSSNMDTMESGTKMYMSLYPEGSSDGSTFYCSYYYNSFCVWASIASAASSLHFFLTHSPIKRSPTLSSTIHPDLRLGNIVPDFSCDTTQGHWDSFHEVRSRYTVHIVRS